MRKGAEVALAHAAVCSGHLAVAIRCRSFLPVGLRSGWGPGAKLSIPARMGSKPYQKVVTVNTDTVTVWHIYIYCTHNVAPRGLGLTDLPLRGENPSIPKVSKMDFTLQQTTYRPSIAPLGWITPVSRRGIL